MLPIQEYINHFSTIWDSSSEQFPLFSKTYTEKEKRKKEKNFEQLLQKMQKLHKIKPTKATVNEAGNSFFLIFKSFLKTVFDFEENHLKTILSEDFKNVSKKFISQARKFAPEIGAEGIYQGMRNVWVMNGIQFLLGLPVEITPSVFAYSMMYPYSDNLLDNPGINAAEKKLFSEHFNKRLHGESIKPCNSTEKQLFRLTEMIENEFPRDKFPDVYEGLYAIQHAQTNSLRLTGTDSLTTAEIQNICFEKGGASVLTDGLLVAGKLNREQQQALFGYGVYLQVFDDIQDVKEDLASSLRTLFSSITTEKRNIFVNKTCHFGRRVMEEMGAINKRPGNDFENLMLGSIETMLIESVGINNEYFEAPYIAKTEKYFPLHYDFTRKKRAENKSKRIEIFQKYFNARAI